MNEISAILSCPFCTGPLDVTSAGCKCRICGTEYSAAPEEPLDFCLKKQKTYNLTFDLADNLLEKISCSFEPLNDNESPEVDFSGIKIPFHLSKTMLSYFPRAKCQDSLMLDLGCGAALHKDVCEHAGFKYIGIDYNSIRATMLCDAHALPFKDNSFDFLLSIAVIEHLQYPFVAMREAFRILKPGGKFIGTVSFLEPFHENSFYHCTHLGIFNLLKFGGFSVAHIAPSKDWSVIVANARMGMFPMMPGIMQRIIVWPIEMIRKSWLRLGLIAGKKNINAHVRNTTGAFIFIAHKEDTCN